MKVKVKLKDITSYSKGQQINKEDVLDNGKYNYLNGGMDFSGKVNLYNVDINTVTVSEGGNSCGYVNYIDYPFWCGAHCYYLYNNNINTKYLYYALKSQQNRLMKLRSGACMPNIKKSVLGDFEFYIDNNKDKQKQIVSILDTVSGIIEKRKKQLEDLDELVKARFVEMFGDPVCNSKNLPTKQLCEACYLKAGITTSADKIHDLSKNYKIPCYGGNGIRGYVEKPVYKGEYPIIGRQGALCGNVQLAKGEFYATEHAVLVTPLIEINVLWLYYLLKLMDLYRFHTGAAQPGLSVKTLNKIDIPIAEFHLQNQFADFVKQTEEIKEKVQKSLDETQVLFDKLMQDYF